MNRDDWAALILAGVGVCAVAVIVLLYLEATP